MLDTVRQLLGGSKPAHCEAGVHDSKEAVAQKDNHLNRLRAHDNWSRIYENPIFDAVKDEAIKRLGLESKKMRHCVECDVSGVEDALTHTMLCSSDRFISAGMGLALWYAVEAGHIELIALIKDKSMSLVKGYRGVLSADYLIRSACLAAEKGQYDVILLFNHGWVSGVAGGAGYLSQKNKEDYIRFIKKVLMQVYQKDLDAQYSELHNLSNIPKILNTLFPERRNRMYESLQSTIDADRAVDLLAIVGCGDDASQGRYLLVTKYGVLWKPRGRPEGSDMILYQLAESVLRENKSFFEPRLLLWLRVVMKDVKIRPHLLLLLEKIKKEVMHEKIPYSEKLYIRSRLYGATAFESIKPTPKEEFYNSFLRMKRAFSCCPRTSRREGSGMDDADEMLLMGFSSNESHF